MSTPAVHVHTGEVSAVDRAITINVNIRWDHPMFIHPSVGSYVRSWVRFYFFVVYCLLFHMFFFSTFEHGALNLGFRE